MLSAIGCTALNISRLVCKLSEDKTIIIYVNAFVCFHSIVLCRVAVYSRKKCQEKDCLQSLLDETRKQLKQSCETSQYEFNQYTEKVKAKDEEIQQLTQNIRKLKTNLDTAQDEVIQLKNHIAAQLDANMAKETSTNKAATNQQQHRNDTQSKPKVLFLGTSNIKAINEAKLTTAATVEKVVKYTLKETVAYVTSHEDRPDLVVLHSLTNDLKHLTPQQCIDELDQLISLIHDKWSLAKIIISLTTPRKDDIGFFTNGQIINALVKQSIIGNEVTSVTYCEHSNMLLQGNPINDLLTDDKFHLSTKGVSILASNIKKSIHWALDIPMPTQQRGRSQSMGPRGYDRGTRRHFQWVKLEKQFFGFDKDLFIYVVYNPPEGLSYSKGLDHDILTCLEKDIASYQKQGNILLCGDFNARVASDTDFIIDDSNNLSPLYQSYFSDKQILERRSKDDKLDSRGRDLLDLCISNQIRILNGRVLGDTFGGLTCYTPNGASTVDYVLVSESILNQILYMRICNFIPTLSDCHCLLEWSLSAKYCLKTDCDSVKTHKMSPGFIWSDDSQALFQDALFTAEIQQRLDKFLKLEPIDSQNAIDSASLELTDIIITAANISLKRRKAQTGKGVKHQKCYGKIYSRFPRDPAVKGHFYKLQRLYTKARKQKYREYKQSLLKQIETLHEENPKQYWQLIDELQGKEKDDKSALVAPFDWLNHFKNLTEPKDEFKERLQFLEEKLNILEKRKCFNELDSRISETEISTALSSLKINKAAGLDYISNNQEVSTKCSDDTRTNEQKINNWTNEKSHKFLECLNLTEIENINSEIDGTTVVTQETVDMIISKIGKVLINSAGNTFGFKVSAGKKSEHRKNKPWFDHDCKAARSEFRKMKRNKNKPFHRALVSDAEKRYKNTMNKAHKKYRSDFRKKMDDLKQKDAKEDETKVQLSLRNKNKSPVPLNRQSTVVNSLRPAGGTLTRTALPITNQTFKLTQWHFVPHFIWQFVPEFGSCISK
ncbi:unnamed protein product [Mytilus edulis]|uniref:Endonuclease/exonuclease/phosphatase domain-containing protein n=1 Tax=Mytilus edulis TaxID=6550 RepID=A0A8S3RX44_MYTED|nr:unnamed protein product [Mytilus edulis]